MRADERTKGGGPPRVASALVVLCLLLSLGTAAAADYGKAASDNYTIEMDEPVTSSASGGSTTYDVFVGEVDAFASTTYDDDGFWEGAGYVAPSCGDGTCNGDESCTSCSTDCGSCPTSASKNSMDIDVDAGCAGQATVIKATKYGSSTLLSSVKIEVVKGGETVKTAYTDDNGKASITLSEGCYSLKFTKHNYYDDSSSTCADACTTDDTGTTTEPTTATPTPVPPCRCDCMYWDTACVSCDYDVCHPTDPVCPLGQVQCSDGTCAFTSAECASICPADKPITCADGTCAVAAADCPTTTTAPTATPEPTLGPCRCDCLSFDYDCTACAYDVCHPTDSVCSVGFIQCSDGTCAVVSTDCPTTAPEPTLAPCEPDVECWDGTCAATKDHCPPEVTAMPCPEDAPYQCPDGRCAKSPVDCGVTGEPCPATAPYKCPDGSCAPDAATCGPPTDCPSGMVKCPDGSCMISLSECPVPPPSVCPAGMQPCPDGSCAYAQEECPTGELPVCPPDRPIMCADGSCKVSAADCATAFVCPAGYIKCPDGTCGESPDDCMPGATPVATATPRPLKCIPGQYVLVLPAGTACSSCQPGFFSDEGNAKECKPCAPGTYSDLPGANRCKKCNAGTYFDGTAGLSCLPCPKGTDSSYGATKCIPVATPEPIQACPDDKPVICWDKNCAASNADCPCQPEFPARRDDGTCVKSEDYCPKPTPTATPAPTEKPSPTPRPKVAIGGVCFANDECAAGNCQSMICCPAGKRCCKYDGQCGEDEKCNIAASFCIPRPKVTKEEVDKAQEMMEKKAEELEKAKEDAQEAMEKLAGLKALENKLKDLEQVNQELDKLADDLAMDPDEMAKKQEKLQKMLDRVEDQIATKVEKIGAAVEKVVNLDEKVRAEVIDKVMDAVKELPPEKQAEIKEKAKAIAGKIKQKVKIEKLEAEFKSGRRDRYSKVSQVVENTATEPINNPVILLEIPKGVAVSALELQYDCKLSSGRPCPRPRIVRDDPIVAWDLTILEPGETVETSYTAKGDVSEEDIEAASAVVVTDIDLADAPTVDESEDALQMDNLETSFDTLAEDIRNIEDPVVRAQIEELTLDTQANLDEEDLVKAHATIARIKQVLAEAKAEATPTPAPEVAGGGVGTSAVIAILVLLGLAAWYGTRQAEPPRKPEVLDKKPKPAARPARKREEKELKDEAEIVEEELEDEEKLKVVPAKKVEKKEKAEKEELEGEEEKELEDEAEKEELSADEEKELAEAQKRFAELEKELAEESAEDKKEVTEEVAKLEKELTEAKEEVAELEKELVKPTEEKAPKKRTKKKKSKKKA